MACLHTAGCPLFPHLRSSLQGWREYYCDSEETWRDCARYKMSLTGERVPITLLPNGRTVRYIGFTPTATSDPSPSTTSPQAPDHAGHRAPGMWARLVHWMKGSA